MKIKKFIIGFALTLFIQGHIVPHDTASRDNNLEMGNPSNATATISEQDNFLITKTQFTLSYNSSKGEPNWVSWHLSNAWKGDAKRCNCFATDNTLPSSFDKITKNDYAHTGFDRGHLCPSEDRDANEEDNKATFLMSNMIPQSPHLNRITWVALETYCRKLIDAGDELYIIAGGYGSGGIGERGEVSKKIVENINVPAHCWKIVVMLPEGSNDLQRINNATRIIAVDMPNNQVVNEFKWEHYRVTVDEIENITGYNFLNKIPKSIQEHLESKKDQLQIN